MPILALELLVAADKYDLADLRIMSEQVVKQELDVENVSRVLMLARLHNSIELKEKAMAFLTNNMSKVVKTEGWKELVKSKPEIMEDILLKTFQKSNVQ